MAKVKMRKIELKNITESKEGENIDYKSILTAIVQAPKNKDRGTSPKEMRDVLPIMDALEEAKKGDHILLTESQWSDLKDRADSFPYAFNSRAILRMVDDIKEAPEVEMAPADKTKKE